MALDLSSNSPVSQQRINQLYPGIRPLAYRVLEDIKTLAKRPMNVVQGLRSLDEQLSLYAQGRTLAGDQWSIIDSGKIVTNAKPGMSFHCYGLAFDCAWAGLDPYLAKETPEQRNILWQCYGGVVQSVGMTWGGKAIRLINGVIDLPHAEMTYGLSINDCLELFEHGGIAAVWAYLDRVRGVPQGQDWSSLK